MEKIPPSMLVIIIIGLILFFGIIIYGFYRVDPITGKTAIQQIVGFLKDLVWGVMSLFINYIIHIIPVVR